MQEFVGKLNGQGRRIGVVVSRFNETITKSLLEGALDGLTRLGVASDDITVVWVPGAFEMPVTARALADRGDVDVVILLGCVIRGATAHFDYVAGGAAAGAGGLALDSGVPVIFGVLTTDTIEQAVERSGTKAGNKGFEAAQAAIEMADLMAQLKA
ncbi:MAG: 6,7-dimethyl-8-ribityllumazine synthase [Acidimicrobiia bacterium]|nr:6,7-dimethyl-8-ribityllumazine synthase [Acidimicrobiia bacterium]MBP8182229.1 6,7-dimethyl-8-ribityllumazine synthase [Acidimicrobiia bacterium]